MICYKDKTFCSASNDRCFNTKCYRFLSDDERERSKRVGLPIAYSDFFDICKERMEK